MWGQIFYFCALVGLEYRLVAPQGGVLPFSAISDSFILKETAKASARFTHDEPVVELNQLVSALAPFFLRDYL
jgi:hypothetical protein